MARTGRILGYVVVAIFLAITTPPSDAFGPTGVWYYCDPLKAYYPYVSSCPASWREVPVNQGLYQQPNPIQAAPAPERSTPHPEQPPATSQLPAGSTAFEDGRRARAELEAWFASLSGDYQTGALYWSGQRSLPKPGSCLNSAMSLGWQEGCKAAQVRLAPTDARRHSEPDFRLGWNAPVTQAPQQAEAAAISPGAGLVQLHPPGDSMLPRAGSTAATAALTPAPDTPPLEQRSRGSEAPPADGPASPLPTPNQGPSVAPPANPPPAPSLDRLVQTEPAQDHGSNALSSPFATIIVALVLVFIGAVLITSLRPRSTGGEVVNTGGANKVVVVYRGTSTAGVLSALFGCMFAILGMLIFGALFLPFAALCSLISLVRSAAGLSLSGFGAAVVSSTLTVIGFVISPSAWILLAAILGIGLGSGGQSH